jgi:hypothetical protein
MIRLVAALLFLTSASPTYAQVVTRCGASSGTAFFLKGPLVENDQSGWAKDGVSGGSIMFMLDGKQADIVYTDSLGSRSARADGAEVFIAGHDEDLGTTLVLLLYSKTATAEHYLFRLNDWGIGEVVWSIARAGGNIQKSGVYHAQCGNQ